MKISVIIPHYNSVKSLKRLLDSIPLDEDLEVIIVDDKSNEGLEEYDILRNSFINDRIIFLQNTSEYKGAGVCRNIGLGKARGEWILFADADDYFAKDFYKIISQYFSCKEDIIFFKPTSTEEKGNKISDRHKVYAKLVEEYICNNNYCNELNLRYKFVVPWSKMIKKQLIDQNNIIFSQTMVANDVIFSTHVGYYAKKIKASEEIIYCVTKSRGTLTTIINKNTYQIRLNVFIDYYNYLKNNLNKKEFGYLKLNGKIFIINSIKYKLGIEFTLKTINKLIKNKIKLCDKEDLNLLNLNKRVLKLIRLNKKQKKYIVR